MRRFLTNFKKCLQISFVLSLLLLVSCGEEPIVKEGIDVIPVENTEYSESTDSRASEVIQKLLISHLVKDTGVSLTPQAKDRIVERAEAIRLETRDLSVNEADYISFINALDRHAERLAELLVSFSESDVSVDSLRALYVDLSSNVDGIYTGRLFYHLSIYIYDYKYDKQMALFSEHGYPHLKIKAEELAAQKAVFVSKVGEKNCAEAMQIFLLASDLFFGGAFDDGILSSFSDEEVLLILRHADFSEVKMDSEAWELLLSYYFKAASFRELDYFQSLLKYMIAFGDVGAIADVMNEAVYLVNSVKLNLGAEDIHLLRSGNTEAFVSNVFLHFCDADWNSLDMLFSADIDKQALHSYAVEHYGEEYLIYASRVEGISITELRESVGKENFGYALEQYLAGISPAISYGVKR